jgi:hypothetical protein
MRRARWLSILIFWAFVRQNAGAVDQVTLKLFPTKSIWADLADSEEI